MIRGTDGPDGKEKTSASHLEIGHPVYTLGTGAGMNSIKNSLLVFYEMFVNQEATVLLNFSFRRFKGSLLDNIKMITITE